MIVEIRNGESSHGELCICEFQGEIVGELPGNELGKITLLQDGKVEMKIGQHSLEGDLIFLKQPFLVVERRKKSEDDICMDILGVVKKKALFKTRPKPIT